MQERKVQTDMSLMKTELYGIKKKEGIDQAGPPVKPVKYLCGPAGPGQRWKYLLVNETRHRTSRRKEIALLHRSSRS